MVTIMEESKAGMELDAKLEPTKPTVYEQIISHIGISLETMDKEIAGITHKLESILVPEKSVDRKPEQPAAPQDHVPSSLETKLSSLAGYANQTLGRLRELSERIVM